MPNPDFEAVGQLDPKQAARYLATANTKRAWLDAFAEHLDELRTGHSLRRTLSVWGLNQSQAAELFGVTRQALSKWLDQGTPNDRVDAVADLAAATDLLTHYLKRDRIPAVVRRPIAARNGRSLVNMIASDETQLLLQTCRDMFDFHSAQPAEQSGVDNIV